MDKKKPIKLDKLTKQLSYLFLPLIRNRGNSYVKAARVNLVHISDNLIKAKIKGNSTYNVTLDIKEKDENAIKVTCNCPFFRQGILCKHIWATIVATERYFTKNRAISPPKKVKHLTLDELFSDTFFEQLKTKLPWKETQDFILVYELIIDKNEIKISAYEQYVKKDGSFGRIKKLSQRLISHPKLPNEDRLIISFLSQLQSDTDLPFEKFLFPGYSQDPYKDISLSKKDLSILLPLLAKTKRCIVIGPDSNPVASPLLPGNSDNIKFEIASEIKNKDKIKLKGHIIVKDKKIDLNKIFLIETSPAFFIYKHHLYKLSWPPSSWLKNIIEKELPTIKKSELPKFIQKAASYSLLEHLNISEELLPKKRDADTIIPNLILNMESENSLKASVFFIYNKEYKISLYDSRNEIFDEKNWQIINREIEQEEAFINDLINLGFSEIDRGIFEIDINDAVDAIDILDKKGVILEATDGKRIKTSSIKGFNISSGINWFELDGDITFGEEEVALPTIISAYKKGHRIIRLSSGEHGILPIKWIEKHKKLFELAKIKKDKTGKKKLEFPSTHALLIENLLEEAKELSLDENFKRIRKNLINFKGIKPKKAPSGFRGKLRPYQKDALGWFEFLRHMHLGGILADDMGLGKTIQVLALLEEINEKSKAQAPHLIVAPTSLVFNWQCEAEKFTPNLKFLVYVGAERKRLLNKLKNGQVLLTTYGILRRDISILKDIEFYYSILDESQYIKNPESQTAKASRLLKAKHRLCLTGTPIENHLGELWSQMEFLNPGMLGSKDKYMERFAKPASMGEREVLDTLKRIVAPVILRRTKEEVAKDLPDKIESIIRCTMTPNQEALYQKIRDHYRASILQAVEKKGLNKSKMMVLEGLLRLRQIANHPALIGEPDIESGKFTQLLDLLDETLDSGHKVLIFSQFTKMLKLIKDELAKKGVVFEYLDGRTPQAKREERVKNFQRNSDIRAFLISLRAGGFGLNLTSADYVFIVDPWWNPAVELQAIDRTHRIGQTKKVVTYRLISKNSVEEKVLMLQKKKQEIVGSILSGSKDLLKSLTSKDLEILFS